MDANSPRVFISYSHDSPEHQARILALSNLLRREGVDCRIDQYEQNPAEGWPLWCNRQIEQSQFVLVACTQTYLRRFKKEEIPGKGLGVVFEDHIITQELYDAQGSNTKFIPITFTPEDSAHIPVLLRGASRFQLAPQYEDLYRLLTNQPKTPKPGLGKIKKLAPLPALKPKPNYDPNPYIHYLRKETGLIELSRISDSKRNDVPIDKLWVPSKVRLVTAAPEPKSGKSKKRRSKTNLEAAGHLAITPIAQAVKEHRLLLIRGEAGSGKSLLVKRIAYALVRETPETQLQQLGFHGLPLWVQISALDKFIASHPESALREDDPQWIPKYFADLAKHHHWTQLDDAFFRTQLEDKNAILLLDGLDEASSSHGRLRIGQLFKKAAETFQCRIIVTTRPEAGIQLPTGTSYAFADLLELDDTDIKHFIASWASSVASADAEKLDDNLKKLGPRSDLRKLARNPQMLTILAILSHGNRLPEHRAAALEQIVSTLAASRYQSHQEAEKFIERISYLALGMVLRPAGKYQIDIETAAAEILFPLFPKPNSISAARLFLEDAQIKSGILTMRGSGDLVFSHKLVQEFLAAKGLTNEEAMLAQAIQIVQERQSPEVIRFLPGKSISGHNRIKGVIKALIEDALKKDLETQAYTAGIVSSMLRDGFELGENAADCYAELLKKAHSIFNKEEAASIDIKIRLAAAEALALGGQLPPLPKDKDYWVRIAETQAFRRGAQTKVKDDPHYDPEAQDDETPPKQPLPIDAFDLGRHPVTVHEYQCYLADEEHNNGAKQPPDDLITWEEQKQHPSRPVVNVSCHDANAYCDWLTSVNGWTCTLPTEDQWEFAARGSELRKYPWSNDAPSKQHHANYGETGLGHPTPVGLFPAGATSDGVLDMAGNVWEWTASYYSKDSKVLRGGAFVNDSWDLRAACRNFNAPVYWFNFIGFRCLREVRVP